MARPTAFEALLAAVRLAERERYIESLCARSRDCPATLHNHPTYRLSCSDCMGKVCAKMQAKGLADDGSPLPSRYRPACGARTRAGRSCTNKVIPGMYRCKHHGGKSTGPRTPEGKARIAEAQRKRWAKWRIGKQDV